MPTEKENSPWRNFRPILRELRIERIVRLFGSFDSIETEPKLHIEINDKGSIVINQPIECQTDLIIVRLNELLEIHLERQKEDWGESFFIPDEAKQRLKKDYPEFFYVTIPDLPGCLCHGSTVEDGTARILEQMERWIVGSYTSSARNDPLWRVPEKFKIIERNIGIDR